MSELSNEHESTSWEYATFTRLLSYFVIDDEYDRKARRDQKDAIFPGCKPGKMKRCENTCLCPLFWNSRRWRYARAKHLREEAARVRVRKTMENLDGRL